MLSKLGVRTGEVVTGETREGVDPEMYNAFEEGSILMDRGSSNIT